MIAEDSRRPANLTTRRRSVVCSLLVCLMSTVLPRASHAAGRATRATLLQVHVTEAVIVELPSNSKSKLLDVNEFDMRKRETVTVDVVDYNPLLFEYEAVVTETETEQHKVANERARPWTDATR